MLSPQYVSDGRSTQEQTRNLETEIVSKLTVCLCALELDVYMSVNVQLEKITSN